MPAWEWSCPGSSHGEQKRVRLRTRFWEAGRPGNPRENAGSRDHGNCKTVFPHFCLRVPASALSGCCWIYDDGKLGWGRLGLCFLRCDDATFLAGYAVLGGYNRRPRRWALGSLSSFITFPGLVRVTWHMQWRCRDVVMTESDPLSRCVDGLFPWRVLELSGLVG